MEATPRRSSLSARVNSLEDVVEELSGALEAQLAHAAIYAEVEESLLAREQALLAREAIAADEDEAFDKALRSRCCGFSFFYHPGTPVQLPWIFPAALAGLAAAYALIVTSPTPANAAAARAAAAAAAKALAEAQSARSVFVATVLRILSLFTSLAVADEVDIPYIGIIECGQDLRATAGWGVLGLSVGVILATLYILPPMQKLSRSYRAHINPSLPPLPSEASSLDHADPAAVAAAAAGKSPSVANLSLQLPLPEGSQGIKALAREAEAAPLATPISQKFAALSPRTFAAASAVKPRPAPISPLTASPAHSHSAPFASPFRLATSPVAAIARPPGSAVRLTPAAARWLLQQAGNPVDWDLPSRGRARASDDDYDDDEDEEYDEQQQQQQQQQRGVRGSGSGSVRKQRVHVQLPEPSPAAATDNASDKVHTDKDDLHDATRELMYADYFGSPPAPVTTDADTPSSDVVSPVLPAAGPATGSSVGVDNEALADVSLAVSSAAGGAGDDDIVSFGRMIDHTFSASAPAQAQAQAQVSASTSVLGRIINRVRGSKGTKKATRKRKSKADQTMEEAHIAAMLASAPKTVDDSWAHDDAAGYSSHSSSPASSDVDDEDEDEDEDYDDDEKVQSQYADLDEDDPVARAAAAAVAAASGPLTAEEEAYVAEIDSSRVLAALAAASPVRAPAVKTPASVKKAPAPVSAAVLAAAAAEAEAADISAAADVAAAAAVASDSEEVEWPKAPEGVRASLESALAAAAVETPLPEPATEAAGVEAALESAEDAAIAALITRTDALAASRDYSTLYSHLTPPSAAPGIAEYVSGSAELLWRRARACYHTAKAFAAAGDTDAQRARVAAGAADAAAAVAVDDQSAMAHKWVAILSNEVGRLGGQQEKIAQAFVFQEHTRKAIALSPNDPDLQHMLGRFCLEISSVSWAVRRIASVAFGGLPNATVDEALVHFQAAARGEPAWPLNMAWMGKALAKLGRGDEARDVLKQALAMPVQRAEDEEAHELAKKELAAL